MKIILQKVILIILIITIIVVTYEPYANYLKAPKGKLVPFNGGVWGELVSKKK